MKGYTLTGCGGVDSATGANFLLKTPDMKILVDCGLVQGSRFAMEENRNEFPYRPQDVSFLLITHAHMDHIGRIPKLVKDGFKGIIYSTEETKELAVHMLDDAQSLIAREAQESGLPPLYSKEDVSYSMSLWKTISYHSNVELSKDISLYLRDAGHILGSAIIEVSLKGLGKMIAFTGDLGNSPTPILRDTEYSTDPDYMVIESVYGDRNHEPKDLRDQRFRDVVGETLRGGGTVVIPAFSLERTQIILYAINNLIESKIIPQVPVFLDSPLAIKVTEVYRRHMENFNDKTKAVIAAGDDIFDFPGLHIVGRHEESRGIDFVQGPKIIIAGSGMSMGGRVLAHERNFLGDPKSTILLVGYQVPGSIGRHIEERAGKININGETIKVRARIEKISGYSSHKDSNGLVEFVSHAPKLQTCFVAMGENKSATYLAQRLRSEIGVNAIVPEKNREYSL
jgi:metallo-beta-lactamase family protein